MDSFSQESLFGPQFAAQYGGNGSVVDKVTPDMKHLIHPYWNQHPPMDSMWAKFLGLFLFFLCIMSFIGNGTVVYIFTTTKGLRTPANLIILNLAFSDFCMMLTNGPMMTINLFYETWVLGPLMCDIYTFTGALFGCGSIWSMTMVALDRYNVIVKGINGTPMTMKTAAFKIIFIWSNAAFWTTGPLVGWSRCVPEGNMTSCGIDYLTRDWNPRSYLILYALMAYWTPLFLIIYSYWFILSTVSAHEKAMREQAKKMNVKSLRSGEDADKSAEGKLAKVALTTITFWFLAWTPYTIVNYAGLFKFEGLTPLNTIWPALFAKSSSIANPIIYGISHPKYRLALKEKCPCCICGKVEDDAKGGSDNQSQATAADSGASA